MTIVKVEELKGGEVLAEPIFDDNNKVLLGKGTVINKNYIHKLIEFSIRKVKIEEHIIVEEKPHEILREEIQYDCVKRVKEILNNHTFSNNQELSQIGETAQKIIGNVLETKEVVNHVYEIKERSEDMYEHSISVCSMATMLSLLCNIRQDRIYEISVASLLHDLGLRYMSVPYINKETSEMSEEEFNEYKKHSVYGFTAVQYEKWISEIAKQMILFHHEKIDGTGYPLCAKEISMECQIIEICEFLDEHICGVGAKKMRVHEAVEYLKSLSGKAFQAEIVDKLVSFIAIYPVGTTVKLSNGSIGIVVKQDDHFVDRPIIQLIIDEKGIEIDKKVLINLVEQTNIIIDSIVE